MSRYDKPLPLESSLRIQAKQRLVNECMSTCQQYIETQFENLKQSTGKGESRKSHQKHQRIHSKENNNQLNQLEQSQPLMLDQNDCSLHESEIQLVSNNHATFNPKTRYNRQQPIQLPPVPVDQLPPPHGSSSYLQSHPNRSSRAQQPHGASTSYYRVQSGRNNGQQSTQQSSKGAGTAGKQLIQTFRTGEFNHA